MIMDFYYEFMKMQNSTEDILRVTAVSLLQCLDMFWVIIQVFYLRFLNAK